MSQELNVKENRTRINSAGEIDAEDRVGTAFGIPYVTPQEIAELLYSAHFFINMMLDVKVP